MSGKRGPLGKSENQKQREWQSKRQTPEPLPVPGTPYCPPDVGEGVEAVWNRLAPQLIDGGLLTVLDVPLFLLLCREIDFISRVDTKIAKDSEVIYDNRGVARVNPLCRLRSQSLKHVSELAKQFGLSGAGSRLRLGVEKKPERSPLLDMLDKPPA